MASNCRPQSGDVWCGAVDLLPSSRNGLSEVSFAQPACDFRDGVAVVSLFGVISHEGWIQTAVAVREAMALNTQRLVIRVSSRAQIARGAGVAWAAVQNASKAIETVSVVESAGCGGAAWVLAKCCQKVIAEDECVKLGWLTAKAMHGVGNEQLAGHVAAVMQEMVMPADFIDRPTLGVAVGNLTSSGAFSRTDGGAVLAHLTDLAFDQRGSL